MVEINEEYEADVCFDKLVRFLESEELPEVENHERLEFVQNSFEYLDEFVLIEKVILFPIQKKYRGILSTVLNLNKIKLNYKIKYDEEHILIKVENPHSLKNVVLFTTEIFVKKIDGKINVRKRIVYTNKISENILLSPFIPNIEGDFFEQLDSFTANMLLKCCN